MNDVRKNLNITLSNDKRVQNNRSQFLSLNKPVDIGYSTMVNMLVEFGDVLLKQFTIDSDQQVQNVETNIVTISEIKEIIKKYTTSIETQAKMVAVLGPKWNDEKVK